MRTGFLIFRWAQGTRDLEMQRVDREMGPLEPLQGCMGLWGLRLGLCDLCNMPRVTLGAPTHTHQALLQTTGPRLGHGRTLPPFSASVSLPHRQGAEGTAGSQMGRGLAGGPEALPVSLAQPPGMRDGIIWNDHLGWM